MEDERIITKLPRSLPISGVILLILGLIMLPLTDQFFTEEQLNRNALLNGIWFVLIFAAIVIFFMSFIWWLSNRLNFRVSVKTYKLIERLIIGGIVLGVIMMFQPWVFELFRWGFYLLLFSTLAFMTWSHIAAKPVPKEVASDYQ